MNEQQELHKRIEAKATQEQEKKSKLEKKGQQESSRQSSPEELENIQPDTPPQTPNMPRGNRDHRNYDGSDEEEQPQRNHSWSLRDIPNFEGKGEQPFSHLMEFEDYLVASGMRIEQDEEGGQRVQPDYRDIINKFKASLKNNARVWFSMYIEKRVPNLNSAD